MKYYGSMYRWHAIVLSFAVYGIIAMFISMFATSYNDTLPSALAVESGVIVEATITEPVKRDLKNHEIYDCKYEYVEDGVYYSGIKTIRALSIEEAQEHIGEKVEIYIDGKGTSVIVGEEVSVGYDKWMIIAFAIAGGIYTVWLISFMIYKTYMKKKLGDQY